MKLKQAEISRKNLNGSFFRFYRYVVKRELVTRGRFFLRRQIDRLGFCSINLETYAYCNRKCSFCFNHERFPKRAQGVMSEATFQAVIDDLANLDFRGRLSPYFYGDPLLDKRLPELVEYIKEKLPKCYVHISSNGDLLDEELFIKLIRKGVDFFYLTNYEDTENSLLSMIAEKYPFYVRVRNHQSVTYDDRAGEIFQRRKTLNLPCLRPSSQLVINWKGDILLCCQDFYGKYCMGNIHDSSLREVWHGERFTAYRQQLSRGERSSIPICRYCDVSGGIAF